MPVRCKPVGSKPFDLALAGCGLVGMLAAGCLAPRPAEAQAASNPAAQPPAPQAAQPGGQQAAQPDAAAPPRKSAKAAPAKAGSQATAPTTPGSKGGQAIVVLVNDDPISAYDVDQRVNLLMLTSNTVNERLKAKLQDPAINDRFKAFAIAHNPKSQEDVKALQTQFFNQMRQQALAEARPTQRKAALEEIIDERIKFQAAKKANIAVSETEVTAAILEIAKKNDKDEKAFGVMLAGMGVNVNTMKERFRAGIAWRDVVRRQFGHQISIGEQDIAKAVAAATGGPNSGKLTDLGLHRIVLPFPPKSDERAKTAKFADAEALRQKFTGCRVTQGLAQSSQGRFEDLGTKEASTFQEPTRSLLLNAKVGEMTPPSIGAGGVELYAICARQERSVAESKRDEAARELQAQEFELLARKHLKSLRQDAVIDYRS